MQKQCLALEKALNKEVLVELMKKLMMLLEDKDHNTLAWRTQVRS